MNIHEQLGLTGVLCIFLGLMTLIAAGIANDSRLWVAKAILAVVTFLLFLGSLILFIFAIWI